VDYNAGVGPFSAAFGATVTGTNYGGLVTNTDGTHEHNVESATVTGTIGGTAAAVTISNAFVGITETENHETGITINNTGEGDAHENRPPYYAVLFVIKL
jgi:microcystin-dependent protein